MWSSQRYIRKGRVEGFDLSLLERAAQQIEDITSDDPSRPAVLTLGHLAARTGISYRILRSYVEHSHPPPYRFFRIRKKSGGRRLISVPSPELMQVQRWIAKYILRPVRPHPASFAFRPDRSIVDAASKHCGARWLIKLDVAGFFGSISEIQVYQIFRQLNYGTLVAFELARLSTHTLVGSARYNKANWVTRPHKSPIAKYHSHLIGFLPQGAPTSPALSNLIMRGTDQKLSALAKKSGLIYTRYSDDLTFSTRNDFDRKSAHVLISKVTKILADIGLRPNDRKTTIVPPGARKIVLGLLVDSEKPRLQKSYRDLLRQHLYYLQKVGPDAHARARNFDSVTGMYRHIRGKLEFAKMVDAGFAEPLINRFEKISW